MKQSDLTNLKQKKILAQFYSNVALAIFSFGVIGPIFTGIENVLYFFLRLVLALMGTVILLKVALDFLK